MFRKLISIALSCAIAVTTLSVVAGAKSEKIEDVPITTENVELAGPEKMVPDSFDKVPKLVLRSIDILINIDGVQNRTTFMFGNDSIVTGVKYNGVEKISYTYDLLKRQTAKTINTTNPFVTQYQYKNIYNYRTSTLIDKISYSDGTALSYTYDANGNILAIADATGTVIASYTYDSLNQLTGATVGSDVYAYTYDNGGNITAKTKNGVEVAYTYGNTEWKDLLTAYNGISISYDTIGNPLNWVNGEQFTWGGGRQLTGITKGDNTISYTYNDNGIRTSKTVNGVRTDYYLNGTAIIMQKTGDNIIWYTYDENGLKTGFTYNGTAYYYVYNLQGDVIALLNSAGETVARYDYDPWGKIIAITDGNGVDVSLNSAHIANINPIRYRGYYYDTETGLYYLQSRYYDAEVGRFLNADGYISTGQGVLGHNMFAYCLNNTVNLSDIEGEIAVRNTMVLMFDTGTGPAYRQSPRENFINWPKVERENRKLDEYYNCYGNAVGRAFYKSPTGYKGGDTVEKTFSYVLDDIGRRNIRRLNSADDAVYEDENLIALRCGPKDFHFMVRVDGTWCHKLGGGATMSIAFDAINAKEWAYKQTDSEGNIKDALYNSDIIYFAIKKDWDK